MQDYPTEPILMPVALAATGDRIVAAVSGYPSPLYGFDLQGRQVWKADSVICPNGSSTGFLEMHTDGQLAYPVPDGDACQSAYDLRDGSLKWTFYPPRENSATFANTPIFVRGVMYMTNGYLFAVDTGTGKLLARSQPHLSGSQGMGGSPLYDPVNDQVLVWGDDLVAFKPIR